MLVEQNLSKTEDTIAKNDFKQSLKMIFEQNHDVCSKLIDYSNQEQFTCVMQEMRASSLDNRKNNYCEKRIRDQRDWYAKKAAFNKKRANYFFWGLIIANFIGVILAILKVAEIDPYLFTRRCACYASSKHFKLDASKTLYRTICFICSHCS